MARCPRGRGSRCSILRRQSVALKLLPMKGEQAHQCQGVPRLSFFLPETDFCFSYTSSSSGCMGNLPQKMNCRCTGLRKSAHLEWAEVDGPAQPPGVVDPGIPGTPPAIDYLFGSRLF